jgi:glucose-6-phosphate dehydrogenase assembly protein OpcA
VADTVVLDRWSARGVRPAEVAAALATLRDARAGHGGWARTAVMTFIAVASTEEQAHEAAEALRSLAGNHPARIILLRPDPDQVASLSARATLYALGSSGQSVTFEEVLLEVGGQAALHLDSVVETFTLSDLPVAVWYVGAVPEASDPLLTIASAVLIDSRDASDVGHVRALLQLARRRTVVDLSWKRLEPWRELLAGLFNEAGPSDERPTWLEGLEQAEVAGKSGPRRLLGGWLVAQTGLSPARVAISDAQHASLRLRCHRGGETAEFTVERPEGQRLLVAGAALPGGTQLRAAMQLPEDPLAGSLAAALTHLRPDPVWERALSGATALIG